MKLLSLILIIILTCNKTAFGCATMFVDQFSWSLHPNLPVNDFVKGNLGVIQPSFARIYLVIAYRYLINKPLNNNEINQTVKLINDRLGHVSFYCFDITKMDYYKGWINERNLVLKPEKNTNLEAYTNLNDFNYITICNIQADALNKATNTLKNLIKKYGIKTPCVIDWVKNQDIVFKNDGNSQNTKIPTPLTKSNDSYLMNERNYQIACANFYATNYETAYTDFNKLANTKDYRDKALAKYLAIRTLIRQGTVKTKDQFNIEFLENAQAQILKIKDKPEYSAYINALNNLNNFILDRLDPKSRLRQLDQELINNITYDSLEEYISVYDIVTGYDPNNFDTNEKNIQPLIPNLGSMSEWIQVYQSKNSDACNYAMQKFNKTSTTQWLINLNQHTATSDKNFSTIIGQFNMLNQSNKAYLTLAYKVTKYFIDSKQYDKAINLLDKLLEIKDLDLSSKNMYLAQRIQLAKSLDQFVKFGISTEVGSWGNFSDEVPDNYIYIDPAVKTIKSKPLHNFIPLAQGFINSYFSLDMLKKLSSTKIYTLPSRLNLVKVIFLRSALLNKMSYVNDAATILAQIDVSYKNLYINFLKNNSPEEKKFLMAYIMLINSNFLPYLTTNSNNFNSYEWWGKYDLTNLHMPDYNTDDGYYSYPNKVDYPTYIKPLFLSKEDLVQASNEIKSLNSAKPASVYLPEIVVSFAKTHKNYPLVPQALHLSVRCTHLGQRCSDGSKLSKEAFQLLHKNYPNNLWAKKTPYYY